LSDNDEEKIKLKKEIEELKKRLMEEEEMKKMKNLGK
jgi:hypothetical protein